MRVTSYCTFLRVLAVTWPRHLSWLAISGDGLVGDLARLADPAHAQQIDAEGVQAAFVHEGSGHDAVIHEVAGEEPVIGVDGGFAGDLAEAE